MNLAELRMLLTSRHVSDETRDAVWRELVTRARVRKGAWTVAAVGMAMPTLRMIAAALTRDLPYGDPADVDSEILGGYLRALRRLDLDTTDVRARLCQAARCAGERAVRHIVSTAERRFTTWASTSARGRWSTLRTPAATCRSPRCREATTPEPYGRLKSLLTKA
ncbi:hypothetical protein [Microbispora sitophila]|nr:hypothetical protein [Microbispora sitophila]